MFNLVLWVSLLWALIVTLVSVGGKRPTFIDAMLVYFFAFVGAFIVCWLVVGIFHVLVWLTTL